MRAIDGDELLKIEKLLDTDEIRKTKTASWLLDQVLHDIQAQPTLTPPNEPLTLNKKRVIAESCLHYRKSGRCGLNGYAPLDCPRCKEWHSNESNEPLTIEQLREMDGEPVWIERIESDFPNDREWALVFCKEKFCRTSCGNIALFGCYGIGWLAYRRPPDRQENNNNGD